MDFLGLFLDKADKAPLYYQLYAKLAEDIRAGRIPAGTRLPGKRTAAGQLGVSVNTVDNAYQMLAAEGYVAARPRSGFVAARLQRQQLPLPQAQAVPPAAPPLLEADAGGWRYSFATGGLDTALFPRKTWARLLRETLAGQDGLFGRGAGGGDAVLREAVAGYLRDYRGVRCEADQLVVGAGLEVLVGMLARLLRGRRFALEDPGYPKTAHILHNMGLATCAVPVDGAGLDPGALAQSGADAAYLTPSHQFPTGAVMPAGRRAELLHWAAAGGRVLVEDDYDSEFRFDGRPLPCLQGLDEAASVVYAGTFSRSLAPGLRAAYLVLPPPLLGRWQAAYGDYACTVGRPEQHTLARLITGGHFARSLNRARAAYRQRRDALLAALAGALPPDGWQAENTHTGLYFILRLPGRDGPALAEKARAAGLRLRALDEYRPGGGGPGSPTADALVLGYGGLGLEQIPAAAETLGKILEK